MPKSSAGLVLYRLNQAKLEFLLVHPGGPLWAKKDEGAWFVPKGEIDPGEDPLTAAKREFEEETGVKPIGVFLPLGTVKHKSGKTVTAWAFEGDCDPSTIKSNTFTMEWPPKSGRQQRFPEIDRAGFFSLAEAKHKMFQVEFKFLMRLRKMLKDRAAANTSRT